MYIADLHIHSKYSRATSKNGDLPNLDLWARRKGISLVGTGDFTHPAWREELENALEPAEEGLYRIKESCRRRGTVSAQRKLAPCGFLRFFRFAALCDLGRDQLHLQAGRKSAEST